MDQIRTGKPVKMFVYLPVYLKEETTPEPETTKKAARAKYVRTVITKLPFSRIEVGDVFILGKRDKMSDLIKKGDEYKVEQVKRTFPDGDCIAVLEKITFTKKEEITEFLKNKKSVI